MQEVFEEANYWASVPKKGLRMLTKRKAAVSETIRENIFGRERFLGISLRLVGLRLVGQQFLLTHRGTGRTSKEHEMGKKFWDQTQPNNGWGTEVAVIYKVCSLIHNNVTDRSQDHQYNSRDSWQNLNGWATWAQWVGITGPQTLFLAVPLVAGKLKSKPVKLSSHQTNRLPVCVLRIVEGEPSDVWRKQHDTVHLRLSLPAVTKSSCATFPKLRSKFTSLRAKLYY